MTCDDCKQSLNVTVCQSAAGYYVGRWCGCGPYSRESGYFATYGEAEATLPSDSETGSEYEGHVNDNYPPDDNMTDAEADADTLASAGWGTDEDYGYFGGDDC